MSRMATRLLIIPIIILVVSIGLLIYLILDLQDQKNTFSDQNNLSSPWIRDNYIDFNNKRHITVDFDNHIIKYNKDNNTDKFEYHNILMGIIALSFFVFASFCCIMLSVCRKPNRDNVNQEETRPALVARPIVLNMHPVTAADISSPSAPPKSMMYDLPPSYECAVRNAALYPPPASSQNQNNVV